MKSTRTTTRRYALYKTPSVLCCISLLALIFVTGKLNAQATLPVISTPTFTFNSYTGSTFPGSPNAFLTVGTNSVVGITNADMTLDAPHGTSATRGVWTDEGANGISFRGNNTNRSAVFQVRVNASGITNVEVRWTCRRILNNGSNDAVELQWRNGSSGGWNDVNDDRYLSNNDLDQSFTVVLPSAANNVADLRLRWYYFEVGSGNDDRVAIDNITVGAPLSPTTTSGQICGSGTVNLSATVNAGESANWYAAASGGSPLNGSPSTSFTTPSISATTTYFVAARNTTTGGESVERSPVLAIVNNPPAFASAAAASPNSICLGASTNLSVGNGSATTQNLTFTDVTNRMIPDANGIGTQFKLDVIGLAPALANGSIVSMTINIEHTRAADIEVYLVRPGGGLAAGTGSKEATRIVGESIRLISDQGASGNDFTGTVLQTGGAALSSGTAPFTGTFAPEQGFNSLTGNPNGSWTLVVFDDNATQVGQLLSWSITFANKNTFSSYTWSASPVNPTGFTASTQNVTGVTPDATGSVAYTVTGTDAVGCTVSSTVNVAVNGTSTAPTGINATATTICRDQALHFL